MPLTWERNGRREVREWDLKTSGHEVYTNNSLIVIWGYPLKVLVNMIKARLNQWFSFSPGPFSPAASASVSFASWKGNFCLWNPKSWALESGMQVPLTKTGIQYLKSGIHSVEWRIQDCPGFLTFPYVGRHLNWKFERSLDHINSGKFYWLYLPLRG